jgi:peptidyl-prolyl cis-trans isomerase C
MVVAAAGVALAACGLDSGQEEASTGGITNPVVAATVDGRPIYIDDVRMRATESCGLELGQDVESDPAVFNCALRLLIEERLFSAEAERRGLDRDPEVRRQLELARERVLANAIYRDLYEVASAPDRVEGVFRNSQRDLGGRAQVAISQIVLDSRGAALAALRRLQSGERFEALAMELSLDRANASSGGYIGEQVIDDLPPAFRDLATTLEVGAVGGPIESADGWHLIRVESRGRSDGQSLDAARPRIINILLQQEVDDLYNRLSENAVIETVTDQVSPPQPADPSANESDATEEAPSPSAGVGPGALSSGAGAATAAPETATSPSAAPPAPPPPPSAAPRPAVRPQPIQNPSPPPSGGVGADEPMAAGPNP